MFKALGLQAGISVVAGAFVWLLWGLALAPWLYGSFVAWVGTGLLVWRWWQGLHDYHCDGPRHLKSFRRSLVERFFVVGMLLAAGFVFAWFKPGFEPLPMLMGFIVGQLAWMVALGSGNRD